MKACGACSGAGCAHCGGARAPDQNAAKHAKTPFHLVPLSFVASMARVMEAGLDRPGRYPDCWKELDSAQAAREYHSAALRHLQHEQDAGPLALDKDDNQPALVHAACCHMIAAYHAAKQKRTPTGS